MLTTIKYILDSGEVAEYKDLINQTKTVHEELWGGTTNPTLIAKKLTGKKCTPKESFMLQANIIKEILDIVPGAVSAEVYADLTTTAEQMAVQGRELARISNRVYVKLPTNAAGFQARTILRKEKIPINNTLVFSQEQIFAICLHEKIMQEQFGPIENTWPPFISPFIGRLDDIGENGLDLLKHGMKIKSMFTYPLWMLAASVRSLTHMAQSIQANTELITAPAALYQEWFNVSFEKKEHYSEGINSLISIPEWTIPSELMQIKTIDEFDQAIKSNILDIRHELTDKGITKFAEDWKAILI